MLDVISHEVDSLQGRATEELCRMVSLEIERETAKLEILEFEIEEPAGDADEEATLIVRCQVRNTNTRTAKQVFLKIFAYDEKDEIIGSVKLELTESDCDATTHSCAINSGETRELIGAFDDTWFTEEDEEQTEVCSYTIEVSYVEYEV